MNNFNTEYLQPAWTLACAYLFPFFDYLIQLLVPAILVFIVARYAQKTFHENARLRENRERSLKHIESIIEEIKQTQANTLKFVTSEYNESSTETYANIATSTAHIPGSITAYVNQDTLDRIAGLTDTLIENLKEARSKIKQKEGLSKAIVNDLSFPFTLIINELRHTHTEVQNEN